MKLCLVETYGTCEITCFRLFPNQNVHILSAEKAFLSQSALICSYSSACEPTSLGPPSHAHSCKDTALGALDTSTWRPQGPQGEKLKPNLLIIVIVVNYDIMWHKAWTKQCCSFVFNLVFGHIFIWPSEERSHFFSMMNILGMEIPPKKSFNECIIFANRMRSMVFPWRASHGMWHYMLKKKKKVEKVNINCLIQFERVCPQCVWIGVVERVTNSFLSLLPWGSHRRLSMKVMFGGWKQY